MAITSWGRGSWMLGVAAWLLLSAAAPAQAGRCGTGRFTGAGSLHAPLHPVAWADTLRVGRAVAPVDTQGSHAHTTEHFRVLWGDGYPALDPQWSDIDGDGVPLWVETLATALEHAYAVQTGLGFPDPYGVDSYYLDAYVGNTGVVVDGQSITIGSGFYAYTEIDPDYQVAYFVFAKNFSAYTSDELGVLKATAAHELFHAVQRAMGYPWNASGAWEAPEFISDARWEEEGWFLEASATWLEEVTVPEVDDYVSYVNGFLAAPRVALNSQDGLHEYGAAVFAGYLWQLYGGADLLRTVYENAYRDSLDPALRDALSAQRGGELEDVVAAFWAQAALPSTSIWPDADQFHTVPPLTTVTALPATAYPSYGSQPGRFGANVIRLAADTLPTTLGMEWADPQAAWRLAVRPGPASGVRVATPVPATTVAVEGGDGNGFAYLAVVNTSAANGTQQYAVELGGDGVIDPTVQWREASNPPVAETPSGTGGSGGCFLLQLGW